MTILNEPPQQTSVPAPRLSKSERKAEHKAHMGRTIVKWITSTDHKTIG